MSQIRTEQFQFSHGKKPKGYGVWGFQIKITDGSETYWHKGMYSDAKKAAIKIFGKNVIITLLT